MKRIELKSSTKASKQRLTNMMYEGTNVVIIYRITTCINCIDCATAGAMDVGLYSLSGFIFSLAYVLSIDS